MKQSAQDTLYQKGQAEWSRQFKNYLKQRRNWEVEFQWGEEGHKDQTYVAIEVHPTFVILSLNREDIKKFGTAFQDKGYQTSFLKKKERDLIKKMQSKSKNKPFEQSSKAFN